MKKSAICLGCAVMAWYGFTQSRADPLDHWHWRNPLPQGNPLNSIVFGNETFVAVGDLGAIVTSSDAIDWTLRTSPSAKNLHTIAYGNGAFVAVGDFGTILSSPDGINWTGRDGGTGADLLAVTYARDLFVAVGKSGTILASSDGGSWTNLNFPTLGGLYSVAYGHDMFVAPLGGGLGGDSLALISSDGLNWTRQGQQESLYGFAYRVAYGGDTFVAVYDSTHTVSTSSNGVNWTARDITPGYMLEAIGYVHGTFLAGGQVFGIATSTNGTNWATQTLSSRVRGFAYGKGTFVAVGGYGPAAIFTSQDAVTWKMRTAGNILSEGGGLADITYGAGKFVAVGSGIATSTNGVVWAREELPSSTGVLLAIIYARDSFVAVGRDTILTSNGGGAWTRRSSGTNALSGIAYGNGTFVAVGGFEGPASGTILSSTNGIQWISRNPAMFPSLKGVAYGNGTFVAVGIGGTLVTSPDGINWTKQNSGTFRWLYDITYANEWFVAVGWGFSDEGPYAGISLTSRDGITWTQQSLPKYSSLNAIGYGDGLFVALGTAADSPPFFPDTDPGFFEAKVFTSTDGLNWTFRPAPSPGLASITYGNGTFVVVGGTQILQSDPMYPAGPTLGFTRSGQTLTLSWATNFVLQATAQLSGSNSWRNVLTLPTVRENQNILTNQTTNGNQFFRLQGSGTN